MAKNLSGEPDTGFTPYSQASSGGADIGFKPYDIPTPAKPTSGDFTTGIKQSGLELAGTAYGLAGLAGAGLGIESLKQYGLENAQRKFEESGAMGKDVYSLEGINSVGDAIDYLQRGVGYVGAQAIPAILSGGVGSTVAKKFVEQGVKELAKKTVAGSAAEQAAIMAAKQQVGKAATRGAIGSMGITGYGQAAGSLYPEMVSEGYDEPGRAAMYAAPIAALDVIPAARAARQVLMPGARKGILKEIRNQAAGESITELGQTGIERQAAYKDLTSPEARSEYLNAMALGALGGGMLGGASAYLNNRAVESNILGTANPTADEQAPLLGLGYTPAAGTPTVFPDGSQALGSESVAPVTEAAPAVASAVDQEILDAASDLGLNLNNTKGKPLPRKVELFTKAFDLYKAGAIDDTTYTQTVERLKKRGKHDDVEVLLNEADAAFVEKQRKASQPKFQRAPRPEAQDVGTTVPAAGGLAPSVDAGGADVSGGLATTGSAPAVGPNGDVGTRVAGISPASDETSLLGNVTGKPTTTLTLPPAQTPLEDQTAIEEEVEEESPLNKQVTLADLATTGEPDEATTDRILDATFANSKDKARDIEIAKAYLAAMKGAPDGYAIKIQTAIGKQFGIGPEAVRKIGNTTNMVNAAVAMGMTEAQARTALGVSDTSKGRVSTTAGEKTGGLQDAIAAVGVESEEGATGGFGYDDTRTWAQGVRGVGDMVNAKDEAIANEIYRLSDEVERLEALSKEIPAIADDLKVEIQALLVKQQAAIAKYADVLSDRKKPTKAKKGKAAALAEPTEQQPATSELTGKDVWEQLREDMPGLGPYSNLSKLEKGYLDELADRTGGDFTLASEPSLETVIDNNMDFDRVAEDTADEMFTEDFESDDGTALLMTRGDTIDVTAGTLKFTGTAETLENLRRYEGFNAAIRRYENDDASAVFEKVELWLLAPNNVDFDAAVMTVQGKRTVAVRRGVLLNASRAELSIHHELGHIADDALDAGGIFSGDEALNLDVKNNVVKAYGSVAKEVLDFYNANPNSSFTKTLAYPLDRAKHGKLSTNETRMELFAQLWAVYNDPEGRVFLDETLPETYQFIEDAYEAQKQSPDRTVQSAVTETPAGAQAIEDNRRTQGGVRVEKSDATKVLKLKANKDSILNSNAAKQVSKYASKAINALVYSQDLFKRAANLGIGSAKKMGELYRQRQNFEGAIEKESQRVAQLYGFIPKQEQGMGPGSANNVLKDMTLAGKWGFEPKWRTGEAAKVVMDDALKNRFNKLSPQAQRWIKETIKNGDESLQLKQKTITEAVNSEYDILIKAAQKDGDTKKVSQLQADKRSQLKKFERLFSVDATKPFAPLTRYGNYVVVAKSKAYENASKEQKAKMENDPDQYVVTFVESMSEAMKLEQKLADEGRYQTVESFEKEAGRENMYGGLMKAFNQLSSSLDAELANATDIEDRNTLARARAVVADLYLSSLAENSARKAEMRRKGVAGEIDMLRSFATRGRANAQFLATVKYTPQLTEVINEMRRETKEGGRSIEKSQMFNEIMARHNQSMAYDDSTMNDFIAKITRGTTVWMLATSPMYYLQNLTQPVMLSIPYMAQRHNYFKAQKALFKAYGELGGLIKNSRIDEAFDFENVPKDVRKLISTLVDRQQIDIGMEAELGKFELTGDSAVARGVTKADRILRTAAQKVEALNRVATAMAAYRMELAKTGSVEKATAYAGEVIDETHGNFNRLNAPRIFNTTFGRVALQFRKFQLLNGTALVKMVYNATLGESREVKIAAREGLKFIFAHTAILTGLVGVPGFATMAFLIKGLMAAFGDDEEPYNLEKEIYEALVDQFGEDAATMVMRGTPTLAGIDVSGKIGMGNVLSILPFTDFELSKAGVSDVGFALAFGATGSVAQRFAEGAKLISGGEYYRGLEKLAPKGFADAMKAMRESDEGVTRLNGDVLVPAEEIEGLKTFAKAIGMPVIADTQRRFLTDVKFDEEKAFKDKAAKLKNQYTKARREGEDTTTIRDKWTKLQDERVSEGFKREPLSSLLQAPQAQAKRERETVEGIQFNKQTRRFTQELVGEQ